MKEVIPLHSLIAWDAVGVASLIVFLLERICGKLLRPRRHIVIQTLVEQFPVGNTKMKREAGPKDILTKRTVNETVESLSPRVNPKQATLCVLNMRIVYFNGTKINIE